MKLVATGLPGILVVEPLVHRDERGFFLEVFHSGKFAAQGLAVAFVQDNHSASRRGTLRGLHLQTAEPQGKLVRSIEGEIFDVAVDVRVGSPEFGRWEGVTLSAANLRSLWIPPGFAHGFCVTSGRAQVEYKCTALYDPDAELTIRWDDPEIGIEWPLAAPLLSPRDAAAPRLAEVRDRLPRFAA
ncbi:MAG TPA: dTDP-4-dehydrorhamnose 3,5-epimerase [Thermoanaerobaculia bacterium]